jgi:transposase-like protein
MRPTRANLDKREDAARRHARMNEPRVWQIKCPACEHAGTVYMPLVQLRRSNFVCRECGSGRRDQTATTWYRRIKSPIN